MITNILITIVAYFVLVLVSVNLLGIWVRGFFVGSEIPRLKKEGSDFIKGEIKKDERAGLIVTIVFFVLNIAFLYALFHFWNVGVMAVAILVMLGRLPDLVWEIRHGKKNLHLQEKGILFYFSALTYILGLPFLYYSLYYL